MDPIVMLVAAAGATIAVVRLLHKQLGRGQERIDALVKAARGAGVARTTWNR